MSKESSRFFEHTEFTSESKTQDPEKVIQNRQDPEIAYAHICKIAGTINSGLGAVPEAQRDTAEVYSVVDLFRATMQYIEEFGSYLRYLILDKDSFINAIIRTSGGDIRPLFEAIIDDELDEYFENNDVDADPREVLSGAFGYKAVEESRFDFLEEGLENIPSEFDLSEADLQQADEFDMSDSPEFGVLVEDSLKSIRAKLKNIAVFYLNFREAYNAVKHGNRVSVSTGAEFGSQELFDDRIALDSSLIEFLCKYSDTQDSGPYLLTIPRSILEEQTFDVVEDVYSLYTQLYDVATLEDGEEIDLNFWKSTGDGESKGKDLIQVANPDSRIILPKDIIPDVIDELKMPTESTVEFTADWSLSGSTLRLDVEFASEPTPEYPIEIEIQWEKTKHDIHEFGEGQFSFSVDIDNLSVNQYIESLKIRNRDNIKNIEFQFPDRDKTYQHRLDEPFEGIDIPEVENPDFVEFVRRVSLATDTRIPVPEFISKEHRKVYDEYAGCSLDTETAEEVLSELQESGEEIKRTFVSIVIWEDDLSAVDIYEDEPVHFEDLGDTRVLLGLRESPDAEEANRFPGEEHRTHPIESNYSPEELLEMFRESYGETIYELMQSEGDAEEARSELSNRIRFGQDTIWGTIDKHTIDIFPASKTSFAQ